MKWFGASWGAPCCEAADHAPTPIREMCLWCDEMIKFGDQGLIMPSVGRDGLCQTRGMHLDCYLKRVLPHTRECTHCRGKSPEEHADFCNSRKGEMCNCISLEEL